MDCKFSEDDVTWSSVEKYIPYANVRWSVQKQGTPKYTFFDKDGKKININDYLNEDFLLKC